ncbi:sensor histidine kinase [Streptomyces sp. NPDC059786]|uniref:sensor histidine kinase n=1 Tax=Streptomyces sp. NPDC059786 TaxID=3346946 RepID=UPI0036602AA3
MTPRSGEVWGSRTLLRRTVDNVVDNAIAHNDPGGRIRVVVRAEGDDPGAVSLVVESGGPVLDQRRVADLALPFRRLGADRTGTGQGSGPSIVAAITQAHHGTLDLRARHGGGLRVTITPPRTDGRATVEAPNTETGVAR